MRYLLPALALLLFSCGSSQIEQEESSSILNFSDSSLVSLRIEGLKDARQPVRTSLSYYQMVPGWTQSTDKVFLQGDTTLHFYIKPQHPFPATAHIGDYVIPFFVAPKDSLAITIDVAKLSRLTEAVRVSEHKAETAYLLKKAEVVGTYWRKATAVLDRETELKTIARKLDSLSATELRFFQAYQDSAPLSPYFKRLEANQIYYENVEKKLYAEGYITGYLEKKVAFSPEDYAFIEEVALSREDAGFSPKYFDYLGLLGSHYWKDSLRELRRSERFKVLLPNKTAFYNSILPPKIADLAKARFLTRWAARLYNQFPEPIDEQVNTIQDPKLQQHSQAFTQQYSGNLKKGGRAPDFYLLNEKEEAYQLQSFSDSLVYISFWATWCKPCIQEFPAENALVEKFKSKPVKIVSICLDSEREKWLESLKQHDLQTLNLYAEGNWNQRLKEKYKTTGYPHYTLIDKQGKVIQNNTLRPSEKADSLISQYLDF